MPGLPETSGENPCEGDGGVTNDGAPPDEEETGPNRRCIATQTVLPAATMIRFVIGPAELVVPDIECRLPGRGIWLSARADMLNTALGKNLFSKAARRRVTAPPDLAGVIERQLLARCIATIGLARRAGQAVMGFEKVMAEVKAGRGALILAAADGAADGRSKIVAASRGKPVVTVLTGGELGAPFGRDHAVHAVLAAGGLAQRLRLDADRLAGFRDL